MIGDGRLVVMDVTRHEPTTGQPYVGYTIVLGDGETVFDCIWTDQKHGESFMQLLERARRGHE